MREFFKAAALAVLMSFPMVSAVPLVAAEVCITVNQAEEIKNINNVFNINFPVETKEAVLVFFEDATGVEKTFGGYLFIDGCLDRAYLPVVVESAEFVEDFARQYNYEFVRVGQ